MFGGAPEFQITLRTNPGRNEPDHAATYNTDYKSKQGQPKDKLTKSSFYRFRSNEI